MTQSIQSVASAAAGEAQTHQYLTFVLGGDVGLDQSVREKANLVLSLSAMTLPHQMARAVLLEQIYRACTLMRNISYHK